MNKKKVTFNDLRDGMAAMKHYGISGREVEKTIRQHYKGASDKELKQVYKEFFDPRKK